MTTRRSVLQGFGAGLGLAALGSYATPARAVTNDTTIPCGPYKILDILLGGAGDSLSTIWYADPLVEGWNTWREAPSMGYVAPAALGHSKIPFLPTVDHDVHLGAGFRPLFGTDQLYRSRVIAMSTESPGVHEIQCGKALCGPAFGRPGFASTGARIAARYIGETELPPAWVVSGCTTDQVNQFSVATGTLGGAARPFFVPMGSNNFKSTLERSARQHIDGLLASYRSTYGNWLKSGPTRVRSTAFDSYEDAVNRLVDWEAVYDVVLSGPSLEAGTTMTDNKLVAAVRFGAHLLKNGARHVQVIGGFGANPTVDTHDNVLAPNPAPINYQFHAVRQNGIVWGVMDALRALILDGTIDDETAIAFGSEFGRQKLDASGSEHKVSAFAKWLHVPAFDGPGLAGRVSFVEPDDTDQHGRTLDGFNHFDMAATMTMLGGVSPFEGGLLDRSQATTPGDTDLEAAEHLATELLGLDLGGPPTCAGDIGL